MLSPTQSSLSPSLNSLHVSAGNTTPFAPLYFLISFLCCYLAAKCYVLQQIMEEAIQNEMAWHFLPFCKLYKIKMNFSAHFSQGTACCRVLALYFPWDHHSSQLGVGGTVHSLCVGTGSGGRLAHGHN